MIKKELEKEYNKIVGEQINNGDEPEDMYPIQSEVLTVALDYVPAKILKRIIARHK
jgi:hypothetical protein